MSLFATETVTTIGELIQALHKVRPANEIRWFRGQADSSWKLVPSLAREPKGVAAEAALIKRFKQNAYALLTPPPSDPWHWLFLMQHHRAPTRLLDWTENPLVALFFVITEKEDADGALWCLDPVGLNKHAQIQPTFLAELPFFGVDTELDQYSTEQVGHTGKPSRTPAAALAPRFFPRLIAQAGVFTVTHRDQTPVEDVDTGKYVGKIVIPKDAKPGFLKDLSAFGITRMALFPELEQVALHAKELVK